MADQTTPTPLHDEVDVFTRPDDIVASVGKRVRIHYTGDRPESKEGYVLDGEDRWGVATSLDDKFSTWRLFTKANDPTSGLWEGISHIALLDTEPIKARMEALETESNEYKEMVAKTINDLIASEDMDDDLANHLREVLDIEAPKPKEVTIEWTVTFTATGTPTTRDAAKKMSDGFVDMSFIDNLLLGLNDVDVDEQFLTVDPWNGIGVSIDRADVS